MTGTITVVGLGLCPARHVTAEGRVVLDAASLIYVIEPESVFHASWPSFAGDVHSFDPFFDRFPQRGQALRAIVDELVATSRRADEVVLATGGNPIVASYPVSALSGRARQGEIALRVVPAVSAFDVFFADLGVDPVQSGVQLLDARRAASASAGLPCVLYSPAYADDVTTGSRLRSAARLVRDLVTVYGADESFWLYSAVGTENVLREVRVAELLDLALASRLGDKLVAGPVRLLAPTAEPLAGAPA